MKKYIASFKKNFKKFGKMTEKLKASPNKVADGTTPTMDPVSTLRKGFLYEYNTLMDSRVQETRQEICKLLDVFLTYAGALLDIPGIVVMPTTYAVDATYVKISTTYMLIKDGIPVSGSICLHASTDLLKFTSEQPKVLLYMHVGDPDMFPVCAAMAKETPPSSKSSDFMRLFNGMLTQGIKERNRQAELTK